MKHNQVFIKVNTRVDKGISGIIVLLNRIDCLITLDSCENSNGWAYVYFSYGSYKEICNLLFGKLAPILVKRYGEDILLSVEVTNDIKPIGKISFREELTNKLYPILKNALNAYRK